LRYGTFGIHPSGTSARPQFASPNDNTVIEMTEPKLYEMNGTVRLGRRLPGVARTVSSKDVVGEEYK
jgi:hypothetical protein